MLVSYQWLKQYVNLDGISAEEVAEKLTRGGIEVDIIHDLNQGATGVVVGHVLECRQHPNADKLNLCQVEIGEEEPVQIVCGAPNVAAGQKVAVAKVGAVLPGNFKIKKAKLRGELSQGMICSLQELGVENKFVQKEFADGIYVFSDDVEIGSDALEALNRYDQVLELDLTPNRSDCLNMYGVAYEVAALFDKEVHWPTAESSGTDGQASDYVSVEIDDTEKNPYYGATIIKNVKVGPSPLWLQNRLIAAGIRPISNVVDVTNYVLLEYGQPLHAFDYDRFGSNKVVTRLAKEGEKMVTLDDVERTLQADHLLITNGRDPVAIAGVMGGATSEVQEDTTTVLLEAAYFDPATVRKASRDLGLRSDSSSRFEKGVDPKRVREAAARAATLIAEVAGGTVVGGVVEAGELAIEEPVVSLNLPHMNQRLGMELSHDEVAAIFDRLGFAYTVEHDTFEVTAPSRRGDIRIEEDLFEEVARLYGYDNIPTTFPVGGTTRGGLTDYQQKRRKIRRYLEGAGLFEVTTYSLTSEEKAKGLQGENEDYLPIRVAMPMSEERSTMRTSLVPHLLDVVQYNLNRKQEALFIYELGSVFLSKEETLTKQPEEREMLAGALTGLWTEHLWQGEKKAVDFFVVKGILEGMFAELGLSGKVTFERGEQPGMHPGRTANVKVNGRAIGFVGQIHPERQSELDLKETYVFQLDVESLLAEEGTEVAYEPLPRFPAISRDIALVVDENVTAAQLQQVIEANGGEWLKHVYLFDLYEGEHMEAGKKSIAFSLTYFDPERTLTDEEVTAVHEQILKELEASTGAVLRG
ncbi:phenylalanine--tRNA ligase subunit beta [Halalkalibacterium halodurans]|uniref:phenylalanine--tRNA ligase subunit beta n=1 Tax=Halalkalibacterium halodurans TaxID=86665 RepID=UPI002E1DD194|nr:phenylalanine--tRNA ligase subunit beta [Halalkalibacterium halodurans]MED4163443.1 phenylalanine--tRNA ligase subunit beta [Halalkalibacterium halodurans]